MSREGRNRDRLVGLFALGVILLNPPIISLFADATFFGWPLLYVYLFCTWSALIAAIALAVEGRGKCKRDRREES
jgi:hypothetical protein